ncbi:RHS repeat domain-containing protein [Chitinophaga sp. MM2321]|uniref:RHS repeat domain-containing protein n=1 Tax=Chitinophaga sp. MM2321 TaxID=3137178 RepID=UPI0032D57B17
MQVKLSLKRGSNLLCFLLTLFVVRSSAQVNFVTGSAEVSLPMFNYSDGNRLAASLSLIYEAGSGVKVNQMAGDVGLGWLLSGGGSITRIVKDQPDDQMGGMYDGVLYATGNLYKTSRETSSVFPEGIGFTPMAIGLLSNYRFSAQSIVDRQQDEFIFQFNNRSGSFVIGGYGNRFYIADDSKLKIEKVEEDLTGQKITTRISKFIITDESGVKYIFSSKETSKILTYQGGVRKLANSTFTLPYYYTKQGIIESNYSVVSKWNLTEIYDPLTRKSIKFNYESYNVQFLSAIHASRTITLSGRGVGDETLTKTDSKIVGTVNRLKEMILPDATKVKFTYAAVERKDLPGSTPLERLVVIKNGMENTGFTFSYKYFSGLNLRNYDYNFPAEELSKARLILDKVQRFGKDNLQERPYSFEYFNGFLGVPGRCEGTTDQWGYFTGSYFLPWAGPGVYENNLINNLNDICNPSKKTPSNQLSIVSLGVLKRIVYPDGGNMEFTYELNDAQIASSRVFTGGLRVAKTVWNDGINASPNVVRDYKYTNASGVSSRWGYEIPSYEFNVSNFTTIPTKGTYSAGNVAVDIMNTWASATTRAGKQLYSSLESKSASVSNQIATSIIFALIMCVYNNFFAPDSYEVESQYKIISSIQGERLNALPAQYSQVTVFNGTETNNKGKEVYEFTNDKDFPILYPTTPFTVKKRYAQGLYGLLKRKRTYNKSDELITDEYNNYSANVRELNSPDNYSAYFDVKVTVSCPIGWYDQYEYRRGGPITEFYPLAGHPQLNYTIRKDYKDGTNYMEYRTDYVYDDKLNIKKIISSNSQGEQLEDRIYYPYDYNIEGALKVMNDNGIISVPVSTETWKLSNNEEKLLAVNIAKMIVVNTGEIKPEETYILNSKSAVPKNVAGNFDGTKLLRSTSLFSLKDKKVYNDNGDLVETVINNHTETNIYDDAGEVVIAKILNAGATDVAYSSFEKYAKGNWNIIPLGQNVAEVVTETVSGAQCLNLSMVTKIEKAGLSASRKYLLSYWKQGGNVNVTASVKGNETTVISRGGWALVTVVVSNSTIVSLTGTTRIDELRLIPIDAMMTTQTFNDLNRVTTIIDAQNRATYTEYDGLGRTTCVRDCDRNIIQTYSYSYK